MHGVAGSELGLAKPELGGAGIARSAFYGNTGNGSAYVNDVTVR
ncbi:hypothetical protein L1085_000465 [Streptomyces sp. MSC1_001]|nr:hypothetical protein [Streptomyces sp. MSC1_001]